MNKRSAIAVALGLVAALAIGGFAIATGLTGPEASQASPLVTKAKRPQPIVRTVTKTVTIHKKAKAGAAPVIVVPGSSTNGSSGVSTAAPSTTAGSTSAYEDEAGSDDEYESEDHESEDHESEDHGSESEDHATEDTDSQDMSDDD